MQAGIRKVVKIQDTNIGFFFNNSIPGWVKNTVLFGNIPRDLCLFQVFCLFHRNI
jgi:hypothetical protein